MVLLGVVTLLTGAPGRAQPAPTGKPTAAVPRWSRAGTGAAVLPAPPELVGERSAPAKHRFPEVSGSLGIGAVLLAAVSRRTARRPDPSLSRPASSRTALQRGPPPSDRTH